MSHFVQFNTNEKRYVNDVPCKNPNATNGQSTSLIEGTGLETRCLVNVGEAVIKSQVINRLSIGINDVCSIEMVDNHQKEHTIIDNSYRCYDYLSKITVPKHDCPNSVLCRINVIATMSNGVIKDNNPSMMIIRASVN